MTIIILGGGIAGLSLAYFLDDKSIILEKEKTVGGLGRSFSLNGINYDIGPHIIFSKNQEILNFHKSLVPMNSHQRSNKILHHGKLVKYPFENDLASLSKEENDYCLQEFLNNPYENYPAQNMLQFFLKTFGEGITRLYLQPYNEKIWKFDPSLLDTQMVERIPKPPKDDVIKSSKGISTEGYLHQLNFSYPSEGGFQSLIDSYKSKLGDNTQIINSVNLKKIKKRDNKWIVETDRGIIESDRLINCMPIHELFKYIVSPKEIEDTVVNLKYNSIYTIMVQTKNDTLGHNFSLNIADKDVIFHRLSKLNFLGEKYCLPNNASSLLIEITFRPNSYLAGLLEDEIKDRVVRDLEKIKILKKEDIFAIELRKFKYAYVIHDLNHRANIYKVLNYLEGEGIYSCGRFAQFEYMNSDKVVEYSQKLAKKLNSTGKNDNHG
jgi:protoporphyrinogen oxidase